MKLYSYWRSTAAYRVRLALNLKGIPYETVPVSLLPGEAEHRQDEYRERNPQMLVPFLEDGDVAGAVGESGQRLGRRLLHLRPGGLGSGVLVAAGEGQQREHETPG